MVGAEEKGAGVFLKHVLRLGRQRGGVWPCLISINMRYAERNGGQTIKLFFPSVSSSVVQGPFMTSWIVYSILGHNMYMCPNGLIVTSCMHTLSHCALWHPSSPSVLPVLNPGICSRSHKPSSAFKLTLFSFFFFF